MFKFIGIFAFGFVMAFLGWYFGYISGAKNQVYFDAVARSSLYEKVSALDDKKLRQAVDGFLLKQKCILASDFNYDTYTINHPAHSDVFQYYRNNIKRVCNKKTHCECARD